MERNLVAGNQGSQYVDPDTHTPSTLEIDSVIRQLNDLENDILPIEALRKVQANPESYIPALIEQIEKAIEVVQSGEDPIGDAHFFAFFLLTEFQAHQGWPAILKGISLPDEGPFILFGDVITGVLKGAFAVFLLDRVDELEQLALNNELNYYVRWSAVDTFQYWVRDGNLSRECATERLLRLLAVAIESNDVDMTSALVCALSYFPDQKVLSEISRAFELDLIDDSLIGIDEIERDFEKGDEYFQRGLEHCPLTGIQDTVDELSRWASFNPSTSEKGTRTDDDIDSDFEGHEDLMDDEEYLPDFYPAEPIRNETPRVGRNEPCPCGSGKKYKKCCGKN